MMLQVSLESKKKRDEWINRGKKMEVAGSAAPGPKDSGPPRRKKVESYEDISSASRNQGETSCCPYALFHAILSRW